MKKIYVMVAIAATLASCEFLPETEIELAVPNPEIEVLVHQISGDSALLSESTNFFWAPTAQGLDTTGFAAAIAADTVGTPGVPGIATVSDIYDVAPDTTLASTLW